MTDTAERIAKLAERLDPVPRYRVVRARFEALHGFHAAARAIHALGMITDAQLKEISDA